MSLTASSPADSIEASAHQLRAYETWLDLTEDLVCLVDADHRFQKVNQTFRSTLGYTEDLHQHDFLSLVHPEDQPDARACLTVSDGSHAADFMLRFRQQDGTYRPLVWRLRPVPETDAIIALARDATPQFVPDDASSEEALRLLAQQVQQSEVRAQYLTEQLRASNEELENFAYIASHDLQEPLRVVASYLQVLQRRYQPQLDDRAGKFIDYAVDGATRMKRLITDLLAYSRIGKLHQEQQLVNLNEVMKQVEQEQQLRINRTGASIHYPTLPTVHASETLMYYVFSNLVSNALKFRSEQPPAIRVTVADSPQGWQFSVSDNGIGISPEYNDTVFDIFRRLNGHKYEGTGMGLSIVKRVIELHQGTINLESQEGQGAIFCFILPKQPTP